LFPHAEFRADAFALYDTAERFAEALERRVPLRGGGALIIETTAAVTVIDIDSGPGKPMEANLAAMPEIARQIRLRGLAGHIVIDVIPQRDKRAVRQMADDLRLAVAGDPTPTQVVGVTPGGLIELRRDRRRASLAEYMLCDQPPRLSADAIGLKGLRALLREAEQRPGVPLVLSAAPEVIAALRSRPAALDETARRLGRPPSLREDADETFYDLIEEER
jgi:hypothetical protein